MAISQRTFAERLAGVRTAQNAALRPSPPERPADDRATSLARWFDARTDVLEGGTALVVERSTSVPDAAARALASLPPAAYFDTETTGLSTGAGTVIFLAAVARVRGA
ncbi:MAG TPA: hypothetical protein VFU21_16260, partial [Kofleriaceae bacterium]|nr:hypothetical protein [Kofleriaceae bacterium]